MANHKSAAKRARQNIIRRNRNRSALTVVKGQVQEVLTGIETKKGAELKEVLAKAVKEIEKARASGLLHPNNAARKVSRLTRKVQAVK